MAEILPIKQSLTFEDEYAQLIRDEKVAKLIEVLCVDHVDLNSTEAYEKLNQLKLQRKRGFESRKYHFPENYPKDPFYEEFEDVSFLGTTQKSIELMPEQVIPLSVIRLGLHAKIHILNGEPIGAIFDYMLITKTDIKNNTKQLQIQKYLKQLYHGAMQTVANNHLSNETDYEYLFEVCKIKKFGQTDKMEKGIGKQNFENEKKLDLEKLKLKMFLSTFVISHFTGIGFVLSDSSLQITNLAKSPSSKNFIMKYLDNIIFDLNKKDGLPNFHSIDQSLLSEVIDSKEFKEKIFMLKRSLLEYLVKQ